MCHIFMPAVLLCHTALSVGDAEAPVPPELPPQLSRQISRLDDLPKDSLSFIEDYLGGEGTWQLSQSSRKLRDALNYPFAPERFQALQAIFQEPTKLEGYSSLDQLLESVRCVPYYVDVEDEKSIGALAMMHQESNLQIFRGITEKGRNPFLSLNLWESESPKESLHVLFVFDGSGFAKENVVKYRHSLKYWSWIRLGHGVRATVYPSVVTENHVAARKFKEVLNSKRHRGTAKGKDWILRSLEYSPMVDVFQWLSIIPLCLYLLWLMVHFV